MPILLDAEQMLNVDIYFNYPKYLVLPYKGYLCGQYELVAGQNYYKQSGKDSYKNKITQQRALRK